MTTENAAFSTKSKEEEKGEVEEQIQERRQRRTPAWMRDYTSGEGLSDEEVAVNNFSLFVSIHDPSNYNEAAKDR